MTKTTGDASISLTGNANITNTCGQPTTVNGIISINEDGVPLPENGAFQYHLFQSILSQSLFL